MIELNSSYFLVIFIDNISIVWDNTNGLNIAYLLITSALQYKLLDLNRDDLNKAIFVSFYVLRAEYQLIAEQGK